MNTLISFLLAVLFVAVCGNSLRRHPVPWYLAALAAAVATPVLSLTGASAAFPPLIRTWVWPLFYRGGLAGALFLIVMWTGALPNGSPLMRRLMPIRGELSILAGLLTLGHNAANGPTYFKYLFTDPARLPLPTLLAAVCSLLMLCIMLPLWVTSFRCVRKRMKAVTWKRLQRLAYGFYFLLFAHLCLLYVPMLLAGRDVLLTLALYTFFFPGYAACRICKYRSRKEQRREGLGLRQLHLLFDTALIIACAALTILLLFPAAAPAEGTMPNDTSGEETPAAITQAIDVPEAENPKNSSAPEDTQEYETQGQEKENPASAAQETQDNEIPSEELATNASEPAARSGTYTGTGQGYEGPITVSVTLEDGIIVEIGILEESEDPEFFAEALAVIGRVYAAQNTEVDAVSGATYSSWGILDAVDAALAQAE